MLGRDESEPERLYMGIPAPDYSMPCPVLDQHDVRCFNAWAVVMLQDAMFWVEFGRAQIFRQPRESTARAASRHASHWMKEHATTPAWLPEAPV